MKHDNLNNNVTNKYNTILPLSLNHYMIIVRFSLNNFCIMIVNSLNQPVYEVRSGLLGYRGSDKILWSTIIHCLQEIHSHVGSDLPKYYGKIVGIKVMGYSVFTFSVLHTLMQETLNFVIENDEKMEKSIQMPVKWILFDNVIAHNGTRLPKLLRK